MKLIKKLIVYFPQASQKLDAINDQRVEKVNRLKVAEKDRDNLLDSKVEAESYIDKEKNIRRKKNILYQMNERGAAEAAQQAKCKVDKIQEKMQTIKAEKQTADKRRAEIEKDYESVKTERTRIEKELNSSTTVESLIIGNIICWNEVVIDPICIWDIAI